MSEKVYSLDEFLWLLEQTRPGTVVAEWRDAMSELAARAAPLPETPASRREHEALQGQAEAWRVRALRAEARVNELEADVHAWKRKAQQR